MKGSLQANRIKDSLKFKNKINNYFETKLSSGCSSSCGVAGVVATDHVLEHAQASCITPVCHQQRNFIFSILIMTPSTTFFM